MKDIRKEDQKLKEEIFRESLKVNKEITDALCRLSRRTIEEKTEENKEREER